MTVPPQSIAIVGSREFPNSNLVRDFVSRLPAGTIIVSGGANGVDASAEAAANACGLRTVVFAADWEKLGPRAGPLRNEQIVACADRVVAFWNGRSRGTLSTLVIARDASVAFDVFGPDGEVIPSQVALRQAVECGVFDSWIKGRQREGRHVRLKGVQNRSLAMAWHQHLAIHPKPAGEEVFRKFLDEHVPLPRPLAKRAIPSLRP
jgi:hypothetical protein